jgi:hypothetical protein
VIENELAEVAEELGTKAEVPSYTLSMASENS